MSLHLFFFLCINGLAMLLLSGCTAPGENPSVEGPSAHVSSPEYDAGRVTTDALIDHRFVIENRGNSPLALTGVKSSCGYAAAIIQQGEVLPGKSGHIQISFRPDGGDMS